MKLSVIFLLITFSFSQEWFITNYEYGKMLYHNPRGISCAKCHGENAKGKIIAKYYITKNNKKILKKIIAPNISNITFEKLKKTLFPKKDILTIMPKYSYLTENEVEAIYLYLKSKGKK
ncbi:c-type cytochrome [Caminibacter mediatlanticus]|uniref:Cytochrome c domain-containing protein n=2 Tax=Caminibacter mediatlanticus TB-2 TaxID=391592 RepID=A0AAI9AIZ5_9BACT|nr:c-type cytochrome [Caminibacter mediatlanticus]EDM24405.1 hypothetical protein CMTB2_02778 [Caminibacter mediatlanticus TB-2]